METDLKVIKAVLIDDEELNNRLLEGLLKEYCPAVEVVATALSIEQGMAAIVHHKPHLVFMDVEIQDRTGFEILSAITSPDLYVVVVTAYEKYALKAIKHHAVDYLLKPIIIEELIKAVSRFTAVYGKGGIKEPEPKPQTKILSIASKEEVDVVNTNDIIYLEALNTSTALYLHGDKKIVSSKPLKELQEKLPLNFLRVHKSYIVNINSIGKYLRNRSGSLIMTNGVEIPVSDSKKSELAEALNL